MTARISAALSSISSPDTSTTISRARPCREWRRVVGRDGEPSSRLHDRPSVIPKLSGIVTQVALPHSRPST
jgi:hypothetical protein